MITVYTVVGVVAMEIAISIVAFQMGMNSERRAHRDKVNSIDNADLQCAKSAVKRLRPTQLHAIGIVARSHVHWPGLVMFCGRHHVETEIARKHKRYVVAAE